MGASCDNADCISYKESITNELLSNRVILLLSLATLLIKKNSTFQKALHCTVQESHTGTTKHADLIFVFMELLSLVFISYPSSDYQLA